jgi:outer membrane protein TolC
MPAGLARHARCVPPEAQHEFTMREMAILTVVQLQSRAETKSSSCMDAFMQIMRPVLLVLTLTQLFAAPLAINAQVLTLDDAIKAAEANNRSVRVTQLERVNAFDQVRVARTYRLPIFSVNALGSQALNRLGLTFEKGALGVFPGVGPIPAETTTLQSPARVTGIFLGSIVQPLSQQYKIGMNVRLAQVGVAEADEQTRLKRQSAANEVRRLYYGILQTESGKKSLEATIQFLKELDRDTSQNVVQKVALQADSLNIKAQLAGAEYELLKLDDPLETQKQSLNRVMGRDVNTPFEVDPMSAVDFELPSLEDACARAIALRPEVRLAQLQVEKAGLARRIKSAERIPDLSLSFTSLATSNLTNALPRRLSGIGIQASWDVFDWGKKRDQLDQTRNIEEQATLNLKEAQALVVVDVSHQYRRLKEARKELEVSQALQSAATELLRVTRNRYAQREALLSDALKVQSSVAEADHRYIQALLDLATARADFQKAIGEDP